MKRSLWILAAGTLLVLGAASPAIHAQNSQQARMTSCNADAKAKHLSGDDRKAFMKSCNADASSKGLKGDARKQFMSTCLKGSS